MLIPSGTIWNNMSESSKILSLSLLNIATIVAFNL